MNHRSFWPAALESNVQMVLLHLVPLPRRRRRELDVADVGGAAREDLLRVVNPVHVNSEPLLAGELLGTQLSETERQLVTFNQP